MVKISQIPKIFEYLVQDFMSTLFLHVINNQQNGFLEGISITTNLCGLSGQCFGEGRCSLDLY